MRGWAELRLLAPRVFARARGAKVWLQTSRLDFYSADLLDFSTQTCSEIRTPQAGRTGNAKHDIL